MKEGERKNKKRVWFRGRERVIHVSLSEMVGDCLSLKYLERKKSRDEGRHALILVENGSPFYLFMGG